MSSDKAVTMVKPKKQRGGGGAGRSKVTVVSGRDQQMVAAVKKEDVPKSSGRGRGRGRGRGQNGQTGDAELHQVQSGGTEKKPTIRGRGAGGVRINKNGSKIDMDNGRTKIVIKNRGSIGNIFNFDSNNCHISIGDGNRNNGTDVAGETSGTCISSSCGGRFSFATKKQETASSNAAQQQKTSTSFQFLKF